MGINYEELFMKNSHEQVESLWVKNQRWRQTKELCVHGMGDNFIRQLIDSPTRENAELDLMVTNLRGLTGNVRTGGSLGCNNYGLLEFSLEKHRSGKK